MSKPKAKFKIGQVVRYYNDFFAVLNRRYSPDRVALWDQSGWWYEVGGNTGNNSYNECFLKALTKKERGV